VSRRVAVQYAGYRTPGLMVRPFFTLKCLGLIPS